MTWGFRVSPRFPPILHSRGLLHHLHVQPFCRGAACDTGAVAKHGFGPQDEGPLLASVQIAKFLWQFVLMFRREARFGWCHKRFNQPFGQPRAGSSKWRPPKQVGHCVVAPQTSNREPASLEDAPLGFTCERCHFCKSAENGPGLAGRCAGQLGISGLQVGVSFCVVHQKENRNFGEPEKQTYPNWLFPPKGAQGGFVVEFIHFQTCGVYPSSINVFEPPKAV